MGKYKRFDIIEKLDSGDLSVWTVELPVTFFNNQLNEGYSIAGKPVPILEALKSDEYLVGKAPEGADHADYLIGMCCSVDGTCEGGYVLRGADCPMKGISAVGYEKRACLEYVRRHPEIIPTLEAYLKAEGCDVE